MRRIWIPFLATFALASACDETVNDVQLTFGENGEGLDGYVCRDGANDYLLNRIDDGFANVVDFIATNGFPGCRGSQIRNWCAKGNCELLESRRICRDVDSGDLQVAPTATEEQVRNAVAGSVTLNSGGFLVTNDAPDGWVIVRIVSTAQTCAQVAAQGLLPSQLFGCAYATPAQLDSFNGKLFLGFDSVGACSEGAVVTCASSLFE